MSDKRIAIFVEGLTEQVFVKKLLEEILGAHNVTFEIKKKGEFLELSGRGDKDVNYYILIVDCGGDEKVKSMVLEHRESLIRTGYGVIFGLRDLYPLPKADLPLLLKGLAYGVPTKGIPIELCVAVMEVESWFLQEENHYKNIDEALSVDDFSAKFNFDPRIDSSEEVEHPADLLHQIYNSVGKAYKKKNNQINRTVECLDYDNLYLNLTDTLPSFENFINKLDVHLKV